jgi:hypothetical protein
MKIRVAVEEVLKYQHEVEIEVDQDSFDDEGFGEVLDFVQRRSDSFSDVTYNLKEEGYIITERVESDLGSPYDWELEITDYYTKKE